MLKTSLSKTARARLLLRLIVGSRLLVDHLQVDILKLVV
jgi:hypothetical protein